MKYVEAGRWVEGLTEDQKREFYSTGATLATPEPKWPVPIKKFPTDFTDCVKPNGRHWDWNAILYLYKKDNPATSLEQVKHHLRLLKITLKNRVFAEVPELEDFPTDFRDCHNGKYWDYDAVAEQYEGTPRAQALAHFRSLGVTISNPVYGNRVLRLDGSVINENVGGQLTFPIPRDKDRDVSALTRKRQPPNWIVTALLKRYNAEDVFWSMLASMDIPFDILK